MFSLIFFSLTLSRFLCLALELGGHLFPSHASTSASFLLALRNYFEQMNELHRTRTEEHLRAIWFFFFFLSSLITHYSSLITHHLKYLNFPNLTRLSLITHDFVSKKKKKKTKKSRYATSCVVSKKKKKPKKSNIVAKISKVVGLITKMPLKTVRFGN